MVISAFHDGEVYEFTGAEPQAQCHWDRRVPISLGLRHRTIAKTTNPGRVE